MQDTSLKQCGFCKLWLSAEDIVTDPDIVPLGMAFGEGETETAYYYFVHNVPDCGTTFLLPVTDLSEYVNEEIPKEKLMLSECCEEHCVSLDDLSECHQECFFAPYRRFLLRMLESKRQAATQEHR